MQSIADTEWRLLRIPTLEAGFYAIGFVELGDAFSISPIPASAMPCCAPISAGLFAKTSTISTAGSSPPPPARCRYRAITQAAGRPHLSRTESLKNCLYEFQKAQMNRQPFDSKDFGFDFTIAELTERNTGRTPRKWPRFSQISALQEDPSWLKSGLGAKNLKC